MAILDRACARRLAVIRPGRKNAAQPNRKTSVAKHERSFLPTPNSEEAHLPIEASWLSGATVATHNCLYFQHSCARPCIFKMTRNNPLRRKLAHAKVEKQATISPSAFQRAACGHTRKWLLSKLCPEFADRVQHQQLGANGQPVDPPSAVSPIDLSSALKGWKPKD